uniref:Uncharacterized protein n=1 Tax=Ciona savignyi TaxID=51511 RepID=H2YEW0_CIOSA
MTADWYADDLRLKISDEHTWPVDYYGPDWSVPDDSGTAHLSLVASNGDAVALTSTINLYFGSKVRGRSTGILFNNEMDDFSSPNITNAFGVPPSPSNFIYPGNRPLSSMTPTVITENKNGVMSIKMVVGASGGTKITTGTALVHGQGNFLLSLNDYQKQPKVAMNSLWFGFDVGTSVEMKRVHDQLMPNVTDCEQGLDESIISGLESKHHATRITSSAGSVVQAIVVLPDGKVGAACDSRKGGYPYGY